MPISDRISNAREERGFTKSAFARLLDVTPSAVGAWEDGRSTPRSPKMHHIARVLGVSADYLETGNHSASDGEEDDDVVDVSALTPDQILEDARCKLALVWNTSVDRIQIQATLTSE